MRTIFNNISSILPKNVVIPALFLTGAAVSLAGGQLTLASVFAVAAAGSFVAIHQKCKMVSSSRVHLNVQGSPNMFSTWMRKLTTTPKNETISQQEPEKHKLKGNGILTVYWSPRPGEIVIEIQDVNGLFETAEQAAQREGAKTIYDFGLNPREPR